MSQSPSAQCLAPWGSQQDACWTTPAFFGGILFLTVPSALYGGSPIHFGRRPHRRQPASPKSQALVLGRWGWVRLQPLKFSFSEFHKYLYGQPDEGTTTPAKSSSLPVGQDAGGQTQTLHLRCPGSSLHSAISKGSC